MGRRPSNAGDFQHLPACLWYRSTSWNSHIAKPVRCHASPAGHTSRHRRRDSVQTRVPRRIDKREDLPWRLNDEAARLRHGDVGDHGRKQDSSQENPREAHSILHPASLLLLINSVEQFARTTHWSGAPRAGPSALLWGGASARYTLELSILQYGAGTRSCGARRGLSRRRSPPFRKRSLGKVPGKYVAAIAGGRR